MNESNILFFVYNSGRRMYSIDLILMVTLLVFICFKIIVTLQYQYNIFFLHYYTFFSNPLIYIYLLNFI